MKGKNSEYKLLSGLFFKLLPYQVLLLIITAINGVVDSLYASNIIGKSAMSAIGLFGPLNHFLYAASIMFVSESQIPYGRYLARDRRIASTSASPARRKCSMSLYRSASFVCAMALMRADPSFPPCAWRRWPEI